MCPTPPFHLVTRLPEKENILQAGVGVYWGPDHPNNVSRPVSGGRHTNNVAEIQVLFTSVFWIWNDDFSNDRSFFSGHTCKNQKVNGSSKFDL